MKANSSAKKSTACCSAGVDSFLPKPFRITASHDALQTLVIPPRKGRSARRAGNPRPAADTLTAG